MWSFSFNFYRYADILDNTQRNQLIVNHTQTGSIKSFFFGLACNLLYLAFVHFIVNSWFSAARRCQAIGFPLLFKQAQKSLYRIAAIYSIGIKTHAQFLNASKTEQHNNNNAKAVTEW